MFWKEFRFRLIGLQTHQWQMVEWPIDWYILFCWCPYSVSLCFSFILSWFLTLSFFVALCSYVTPLFQITICWHRVFSKRASFLHVTFHFKYLWNIEKVVHHFLFQFFLSWRKTLYSFIVALNAASDWLSLTFASLCLSHRKNFFVFLSFCNNKPI